MNFAATLRKIVDECGGGIGAALMGTDGIAIEQVEAAQLPASFGGDAASVGEEISALGVEFGRILDEARKAADSLAGGAVEEACLRMARFWVLLRVVDAETFLVLVLGPDGNLGKARYLMRRHLAEVREHL
jgi:predicted regulator of Ras-like GTPase activity (Roadblock/LC7/MglB family)